MLTKSKRMGPKTIPTNKIPILGFEMIKHWEDFKLSMLKYSRDGQPKFAEKLKASMIMKNPDFIL